MTQFFKNIIAIILLMATASGYASCPAGYTGISTVTIEDVVFTICYPETVYLNVADGEFTIYVSITNNTGSTVSVALLSSYLPSSAGLTVLSDGCPPSVLAYSCGISNNEIDYQPPASLPTGTTTLTATLQATASGVYQYIPQASVQTQPGQPTAGAYLPQITIIVEPTNCPQITASNVGFTGCSNVVNGNLSSLVTGGSGPYFFFETGAPSCGQVSIATNGSFLYTAPAGYTGPCAFEYYALDSNACPSSTGHVTIIANIGPVAAANTGISICQNGTYTGNLSSLVTGGSSPYLFFETGAPSCGQVSIATNGSFLYTAPVGYTAPCTFEYYAVDSNACPSPTGVVTITANLGPVVSNADILVCENTTYTGSLLDLVSGGTTPYRFAIVTNGTLGTATITNTATGAFTYVPNPNSFGFDSFVYQVTDATGCSNTGTVEVTLNQAPTASNTGLSSCVNAITQGNLTDLVSGAHLPFSFTGNGPVSGGSVIIDSGGIYAFIPSAGFTGLGSFGYLVTDASGCTATGVVDITVLSPVANPSGISLCTNVLASGNLASLVSSGFPPYTFGPTGTDVGGTVTVSSTGNYVFTPFAGFVGDASFSYQVIDSEGCIGNSSITIDYNGPVADETNIFLCENSSYSGSLFASGGTTPYRFTIVTNGTIGTATITNTATGAFTYVPNPDSFGFDSFTYQVTDANGCVSNTGEVLITVNQTPLASNTGLNSCINAITEGNLNDLVLGVNPPFSFTGIGPVSGGTVIIDSDGIYQFTPSAGYSGLGSFGYLVTDASGCIATGIVDLTISSPIALATGVSTCFNTPISGSVASLVSSGFPPYAFGLTGLPVGGSAMVSSAGLYTFTPVTGFSGSGGFVYQVTDTNACFATAPVTVTVDSLVGNNGSVVSCTDTYASSLTNYVNGGTGALNFSGPLSISCGSVSISPTGLFTYTGVPGFSGPCDFVYQVFDGLGCSATGAITVTANTAPTVSDGAISTCQGVAVSDSLAGLLNEMPQPPLTFVIVTNPTHGALTSFNASTGAYTYTPQAGFSGIDSFQFQVTDSNVPPCSTNVGTVTITVSAAPVAASGTTTTCSNTTASGSLASQVTGGTSPYTFAQTGTASNGAATVSATGNYTFVPTPFFVGTGSFFYYVTDASGCLSNIATETISVTQCCPLITNQLMIDILEQYWGLTGI